MTSDAAAPPAVVLDANVLIPNALRDTLLRAEEAGRYDAYWSDETLVEVQRNLARLLADRYHDADARAQRLIDTLAWSFPAATVTEYRHLLPAMGNHPGDRHILAAAVAAGATIIVTSNIRHFPTRALRPHGVVARTPDQFLGDLLAGDPRGMRALLVAQGAELHSPRTLDAVLDTLAQHAPAFVRAVRAHRPT
jgi:predicted nucleic acid-binding protein